MSYAIKWNGVSVDDSGLMSCVSTLMSYEYASVKEAVDDIMLLLGDRFVLMETIEGHDQMAYEMDGVLVAKARQSLMSDMRFECGHLVLTIEEVDDGHDVTAD